MEANGRITRFPRHFFVTGTDTNIGKTLVCATLMIGMKAVYWKPVQSGCMDGTDTDWIRNVTGLPDSRFVPETYRLCLPLSPHAAADHDGVRIEMQAFRLPEIPPDSGLIVEGAGGVMVPLNADYLMIDLMKQLGIPVLVVARSTLGTINHTLLTLSVLRTVGIQVFGVVLNGKKNQVNRAAIEHYGKIPVVAEIEPLSIINHARINHARINHARINHARINHASLMGAFAAFGLETFNHTQVKHDAYRSEERRVGKECRSRWSPYH